MFQEFTMEEILSCLRKQIDDLLKTGRQILIAIDGNCTAGKTTLAAVLEKEYVQKRELMEDLNRQIQMLNSSLANATSKAAEGTGKVLATIMMLYGRALMEAEAFRAECMKCSLELRELCETTVERLAAAAKKLDSIITLQNTLRPLVEGYESLIGTAGAILSDDIVQSLNESVELMKSYVGLDSGVSGRYDFAAMAEVIRKNKEVI